MRFNRIFLCFFCIATLFCGACGAKALPISNAHTAEENFIDSLIFLGDSTTAHMLARAPLQGGKNSKQIWATKSRYLNLDSRITYAKIVLPDTGEELTIAEAAAKVKPPYLVITLGVDYGVYYYRNDLSKFRFYYEKLLDAVCKASPDTKLILQSVFPVGRESVAINNKMIDNANRVIADIAAARCLVYVDANTLLKDEDGYLLPAYCSSADGIHLTEAAYKVILENLSKHKEEIIGVS